MNLLDYAIIIIYSVAFLGLGYLFKNQQNKKDYFLGGRSFGWFPLSLSVMATQLSAISFISAPAFVGMREGGGMKWLSYEFAVPIAMIFLGSYLIPTLYKSGVVSIYEFLEKRFNRSTRLLLSLVFQISRAFATSVMIYAVALILTSVMDIPFWQTVVLIGVITVVYSYQGGMKAVVYGDMIQMIILFVGILICFGYGLAYLGGWETFTALLDRDRLQAVDFSSLGIGNSDGFGFWPMIIGGFFLYASYYGTDQSQVQRLLSANSLQTVKKTILFNGILRFPVTLSYCIMGLVLGTMVMNTPEFAAKIPIEKPDLMIPIFIRDYLPHGIIGILIVAILSAAMSSLSSAVNSLSAVTTEDFLTHGRNVSHQEYVKYSRLTALFWGVVCIALAFFAGDIAETVIEAINKVGSVFFGPILATFLIAVKIKRVHARGMNIGLLSGVLCNVYLWLGVGDGLFWFWWNATGAVVTLVVAYIMSMIVPKGKESVQHIEMEVAQLWTKDTFILIGFFVVIIAISMAIPNLL
ncbi:sodium:solute symporter [Marinoscillum sp.]|uniref:sodium:solute symporter n=1 Tax=Marinoscillum sp. TaxID=2024838 RepID=UPI003BAD1E35